MTGAKRFVRFLPTTPQGICLSADDPTIFSTSTLAEYERAGKELSLAPETLQLFRQTAWDARFAKE
jgi:adenosine deaminase